jgi:hypothetical protein
VGAKAHTPRAKVPGERSFRGKQVHPRPANFDCFFKFEREAHMQAPARRAAVDLVKGRSRGNAVGSQPTPRKGKLAP